MLNIRALTKEKELFPMKQISILGSTGSIGRQALSVVRQSRGELSVSALCADSNAELLANQANEFHPPFLGIRDCAAVNELKRLLDYDPVIYTGERAAMLCACVESADIVLNAVSGASGLEPFIAAIQNGKTVAAANKESIVCAHSVLESLKSKPGAPLVEEFANGAKVIPVDSEQCALYQCLLGEKAESIKTLVLTASGGMFHRCSADEMMNITPAQAMNHPNWSMGKKITIDSSTMFNKGLEIMEAAYLFGVSGDAIDVVVQPQSLIHSMVRFSDNTIKAQLSVPDMRASIQYAFNYPNRAEAIVEDLDLISVGSIVIERVNPALRPALDLAYAALHENGILPIVYNAANEASVELFVRGETGFLDIAHRVEYAMNKAGSGKADTPDDIIAVDTLAREYAREWKGRDTY